MCKKCTYWFQLAFSLPPSAVHAAWGTVSLVAGLRMWVAPPHSQSPRCRPRIYPVRGLSPLPPPCAEAFRRLSRPINFAVNLDDNRMLTLSLTRVKREDNKKPRLAGPKVVIELTTINQKSRICRNTRP